MCLFCNHKWETVSAHNIKRYARQLDDETYVIDIYKEVQRCSKCGKLRAQEVQI